MVLWVFSLKCPPKVFLCFVPPPPPQILFNVVLSVVVFIWPQLLLYLNRSLSLIVFGGEVLFFLFYGWWIYEIYFSEIKFKAHGKSVAGIFLELIYRWHKGWQSCFTEQFRLYDKINYSNKMCFSTAKYARPHVQVMSTKRKTILKSSLKSICQGEVIVGNCFSLGF